MKMYILDCEKTIEFFINFSLAIIYWKVAMYVHKTW